jgi:DNA-binding beta-propeller fold protein YncE
LAILALLILLLVGLVFIYLSFIKPRRAEKVEAKGLRHIVSIYGFGPKIEEMLDKPRAVSADADGNIYVADTGHSRVVVFDRRGRYLYTFGGNKGLEATGSLVSPVGISVDRENGRVYIADRTRNRVLVFNLKGKFVKEFPVMMPVEVEKAGQRLYVATYGPIYVFSLDGQELDRWGRRGRDKGEFDFANGLTVDKEGNVYVSDTNNTRVVALNKKGEVKWIEGTPPKGLREVGREFGLPWGLAMGDDNLLYLVDCFRFNISVIDPKKGERVAVIGVGEPGDREGQFYFACDITHINDDVFAVADTFNNRVQILKLVAAEAAAPPALSFLSRLWRALSSYLFYLIFLLLLLVLLVAWFLTRRRRGEQLADTRVELE